MKLPPEPSTSENYSLWRKDIELWRKLTDTPKEKMGIALQYSCRTNKKIHEAVLNIADTDVEGEAGIDNVLKVLDELHNVDKKETAIQCYQEFLSLKRKQNQKIPDFIRQFETLASKTKSNGNTLSDDLLAFRLLESLNLSETDQRIIKSTAEAFTVDEIKKVVKKTYGDSAYDTQYIKPEPIFNTATCRCACDKYEGHQHQKGSSEDEDDVYYASNKWRKYKPNNTNSKTPSASSSYQFSIKEPTRRGKNPLDRQGNITQCNYCYSINHWIENCPDKNEENEPSTNETMYTVVLFEDDVENPNNITSLVYETIGCAVLDCGASKSVCGQRWLDLFISTLSQADQSKIVYSDTSSIFKFGSGDKVKATTSVKLPIVLGSKKLSLQVDVVQEDLPLLLSRISMKRAKTVLDTETDTVTMMGEKINLINTSTGHYAIPICTNRIILQTGAKVNLISATFNLTHKEIATKLHRQFAHTPPERLIRLLEHSDYNNNELKQQVEEVSSNCDICKYYKRAPPAPVTGKPMVNHFNQRVVIDLKYIRGKPVLYLIDVLTRYSMSSVVSSKKPKALINTIFKDWITIFGTPKNFISVNEGQFIDEEFTSMAEAFNIHVSTSATETPWINELCERYSAVLEEMVEKTLDDVHCSLEVAVTWANAAKNSLQIIHGFAPAQLVFGYTPMLPSVQTNKPPALSSENAYSNLVEENLRAMKAARIAHVKAESSERIRRALSHNIRSSGDVKYVNGDSVYYRRKDDSRWRGPGTVIGQDGQWVLVRNQYTWVRVHPCRLRLANDQKTSQEICNNNKLLKVTEAASEGDGSQIVIRDVQSENHPPEEAHAEQNDEEHINIPTQPQEGTHVDEVRNNTTVEANIIDNEVIAPKPQEEADEDSEVKKEDAEEDSEVKKVVTQKNTYNKAKKFKNVLAPGKHIKFKYSDEDDWVTGQLVSRSGKVRGKFPNEWNVSVNGKIEWIDFDRKVDDVQEITEEDSFNDPSDKIDDECMALLSQMFYNMVDQVNKAKKRNKWNKKTAYDEVEHNKQKLRSLKWVMKPWEGLT